MTLRSYLVIMSAMTAMAWGAWTYTLFAINPEITNWIGFVLFYSSLFTAVTGTAAIVGFLVRFLFLKQDLAFRAVKEAFRQAVLIAIMLVSSLILLAKDLLTWLNLILLILGLTALEFLLLSLEPKRPIKNDSFGTNQKQELIASKK